MLQLLYLLLLSDFTNPINHPTPKPPPLNTLIPSYSLNYTYTPSTPQPLTHHIQTQTLSRWRNSQNQAPALLNSVLPVTPHTLSLQPAVELRDRYALASNNAPAVVSHSDAAGKMSASSKRSRRQVNYSEVSPAKERKEQLVKCHVHCCTMRLQLLLMAAVLLCCSALQT